MITLPTAAALAASILGTSFLSGIFGMAGAPDLALTQALVETITIVVVVLVLRRLPRRVTTRKPIVRGPFRVLIGVLAGAVMAVVGMVALGARTAPTIAEGMPVPSMPSSGSPSTT